MCRILYLKARVHWEPFCDLCGASKGWVQHRQCPISLSRLTTHARLGNETITNKFYRYILSNWKGNRKWGGKGREKEKKGREKKEGEKRNKLFFFFLMTSEPNEGLWETSQTVGEKRHNENSKSAQEGWHQ